jgi:hypothetical protein
MTKRADIIVLADLHIDFIDNDFAIQDFVDSIAARNPRLLIAAGDLGHGEHFERALRVLSKVPADQRAALVGNHDLWCHRKFWRTPCTSEHLYRVQHLRAAVDLGWVWLENEILRVGDAAIVGSVAWYDYSACDQPGAPADLICGVKGRYNNDGNFMDKAWDDLAVAEECRAGLVRRLEEIEQDPSVSKAVVVTHLPILREQRVAAPGDEPISNAYFYNYTIGHEVVKFPKVTEIVSGHTHRGMDRVIERPGRPPVRARVIGADYGRPVFVEVNL